MNQASEEERTLCALGMCTWHAVLTERHMAAAYVRMRTVWLHCAAVIDNKQVSYSGDFIAFPVLLILRKKNALVLSSLI